MIGSGVDRRDTIRPELLSLQDRNTVVLGAYVAGDGTFSRTLSRWVQKRTSSHSDSEAPKFGLDRRVHFSHTYIGEVIQAYLAALYAQGVDQ